MTNEIVRWADRAMYIAEHDPSVEEGGPVRPTVTLIHMTPNPIRVMAAASELYSGKVVRHPYEVHEYTGTHWFREMTKTKLQAPLEFIDFHFLFEGVTRAFTHQLVRQRTAVYVQESQRFAVKDNARFETALPPSLQGAPDDHPWMVLWNDAVRQISETYDKLVMGGMPAEDARGLLPTNITTKVHYKTNLRNLAEHAGNRLCSQAQYEWKQVWAGMLNAIRDYGEEEWQTDLILSLFKPVCYQTGRCEFRADADRFCRIRDRVESHYARGEGPEVWVDIDPWEPLMEGAARLAPDAE